MAQGTVKWFNAEKSLGLPAPDEAGADRFDHHSATDADGVRSRALRGLPSC
ncbi:cold shock domain-containing protein [Streptomyces sp900129855]|uniref:Cold shock domain-containing protein n=1 Tax=Streptomyces sp. 900129855 TaxID=3155129 RepID=A0ABV2ZL55_9ACTN